MRNENYIPKDTRDITAVERLKHLPFETIKKDIPKLLEWLQDTHWEVAPGIAEYLIPHVNEMTKELLFVLKTDDSTWKYFLINILIARSKHKLTPALISELKRIAERPTNIEIEDTVDDAAKSVLANKLLCD
ncbi:DUF5071 domain-containing protein [Mucilaginibacter sp. 22184]|uniref:DUF5071 domain-containing protein n=1 Tax=Mucilaginibacter sp. 22184 TaxID=3453887 RepID=UPI003F8653B1